MKDYGISKEYKRITSRKDNNKPSYKKLIKQVGKNIVEGTEKTFKSKKISKSKPILRSQRAVLEIKENKPEPYRSIYFQEQYLKEKKNLFLR